MIINFQLTSQRYQLIGKNCPPGIFENCPQGIFENCPQGIFGLIYCFPSFCYIKVNCPLGIFEKCPQGIFENCPQGIFVLKYCFPSFCCIKVNCSLGISKNCSQGIFGLAFFPFIFGHKKKLPTRHFLKKKCTQERARWLKFPSFCDIKVN